MGGQSAPTAYQPAHSAAVDNAFATGIASNTARTNDLYNYAAPKYQGLYDSVVNNPGNATAMQGAWDVATAGKAAGNDEIARGYQMAGLAPGAIQSGWDPQSANYNWGLGQTLGATQVANAQSGVAGSPFGAGVVGDAAASFNRNWQNDMQSRQGIGIDQLTKINNGANSNIGQGLDTLQTSSLLPSATASNISQDQISALNQLVQAMTSINSSSNQNLASADSYLNTGTAAASQATQAAQVNNQNTLLGSLGALAGLGAHFIPGYH